MMSAQELTGAPLISLVPCKSRKARPHPGHTHTLALEKKMSTRIQAVMRRYMAIFLVEKSPLIPILLSSAISPDISSNCCLK